MLLFLQMYLLNQGDEQKICQAECIYINLKPIVFQKQKI